MKKILSMLLFVAVAAFATSCDEVDDLIEDPNTENEGTTDEDSIEYVGTITVSNGFTNTVSFYLTESGNTISILMDEIQFSAYMPTMDITLVDMSVISGTFNVATASTVVEMYGAELDASAYPITNVVGAYSATALNFTFNCNVSGADYSVAFVSSAE